MMWQVPDSAMTYHRTARAIGFREIDARRTPA
ncbi:hypothetical protein X739_07290 [Mesorhizobium sp. LNHC220B00]|nr:hypothetical protein X739_07290 [Mesorhizobium sp. LNHC220B00]ESY93880.1 hypothetical protein X741_14480 [Mesorhizobium sp. LNHC229A00]ESZ01085.1 hypothetical protein X738_06655 [Mesorhizobium sp. LNHC209A00]